MQIRHGPAAVSRSAAAYGHWRFSGKTQPRDDLESEDLPVQKSPLPPASDREEIHIRLYCRFIHMLLPLWAEVFLYRSPGIRSERRKRRNINKNECAFFHRVLIVREEEKT